MESLFGLQLLERYDESNSSDKSEVSESDRNSKVSDTEPDSPQRINVLSKLKLQKKDVILNEKKEEAKLDNDLYNFVNHQPRKLCLDITEVGGKYLEFYYNFYYSINSYIFNFFYRFFNGFKCRKTRNIN